MNTKNLTPLLIVLLLTVAASAFAAPNVIVILADDLGYGDVSYNGCPDYTTPNIDALAGVGAKCPFGYSCHPFCSPARAGLLTGRYQQRFGFEFIPDDDTSNPRLGLPLGETLLPQMMAAQGYATGMVGKWHVGVNSNYTPLKRGFQEFFGFYGGSSQYYNAKVWDGTTLVTETSYLTDAFTREAVEFVNRHAAQPFFLYLAYSAPHDPYHVPPQVYVNQVANIANSSRRNYAATVKALDAGVGQVVEALKANGLYDNTLIVFTSDNGAPPKSFVRNAPYRGYKFQLLEGGVHVPFIVSWPAKLQPTLYNSPVSLLDILVTSVAAANGALPTDRAYDGVDLMPYLQANQPLVRDLFWRVHGHGVDEGLPQSDDTIMAALDSDGWKLEKNNDATKHSTGVQLYNVRTDAHEDTNLVATQPAVASALQAKYDDWYKLLVAPLWMGDHNTGAGVAAINNATLAGDWNGFKKSDTRAPWRLKKFTAPAVGGSPDAFNWLKTGVHPSVDTTVGTHQFVFAVASGKTWGGTILNVDGFTDMPQTTANATIAFPDTSYYTFRAFEYRQPSGAAPFRMSVFKTTNPPVTLTSSRQGNVVDVTTSAPKSPQERVFVRYSLDTFETSRLVEAIGSGTNYAATVPLQPSGAAVQYAVVTSTVDLSSETLAGRIDALVLDTTPIEKFIEP